MDDLEKIKSRIHHSMLCYSYGIGEDEKQFSKVYNDMMTAFLEFVPYCEDKALLRDSSDCSTSDDDQDR